METLLHGLLKTESYPVRLYVRKKYIGSAGVSENGLVLSTDPNPPPVGDKDAPVYEAPGWVKHHAKAGDLLEFQPSPDGIQCYVRRKEKVFDIGFSMSEEG